jgi:hypothetical protein
MGPTGLTAVFGMGTGVTPPVWSPEMLPAGGQATPGASPIGSRVGHAMSSQPGAGILGRSVSESSEVVHGNFLPGMILFSQWTPTAADRRPEALGSDQIRSNRSRGDRIDVVRSNRTGPSIGPPRRVPGWDAARGTDRGGQAVGCWNWSAQAVARRTLPAHRPGRLPGAFALISAGNLVLEGASRLDAFSAYPVPTWLPDDAPSGTAGTPEVGPPQSSRTRGDAPQASYAHGR